MTDHTAYRQRNVTLTESISSSGHGFQVAVSGGVDVYAMLPDELRFRDSPNRI